MDLFAIADKYDVPVLKSMCEDLVLQMIDQSNAFDVFNLGHLYSSEKLKVAAFTAIKSMLPDKEVPDELINDREKLKELIDAKKPFK